MRQFRIVTDGSCDLPAEWCKEHHIAVLPLYFSIAGAIPEPYPGSGEMKIEDFYAMLRQGTAVQTSAPSIEDCKDILRPILAGGFDILYTGLSSKLSGMFNVMRLASMELQEEFPERRVVVLDSKGGSLGLGILLHALAAAQEKQQELEKVIALGESLIGRISHRFIVGNLMFLKRGGRISGSAAVVGTVLQIMPMLHVNAEGAIEPYSKIRGRKTALRTLADELGGEAAPGTAVYLGHCDAPEDAAFVREILRRKFGIKEVLTGEIGPVLGAHAGPDTVAGFCLVK
jgi:DegV family protein with EDD domain